VNGRCGGPHSRSGRFLEEKNDSCTAGNRVTILRSSLTQSLHRKRYPSTKINRRSLRGMSTDGIDTSLELRAMHALHATNTNKDFSHIQIKILSRTAAAIAHFFHASLAHFITEHRFIV